MVYLAFIAGLPPKVFWERVCALEERGLVTVQGDEGGLTIDIRGLLQQAQELTGNDDASKE